MKVKTSLEKYEHYLKEVRGQQAPKSQELYCQLIADYYRRLHNAQEKGEPMAWLNFFVPREIFYAMDLAPFMPEYHCMLNLFEGDAGYDEFYDIAHGHGVPAEVCSAHRAIIGMAKSGLLPEPSFIIGATQACDTYIKMWEIYSDFYGIPLLTTEYPYHYDERGVRYLKEELRQLIAFIEKQTGRKLDYDRLKELLRYSRQIYDYWYKIGELRKGIPEVIKGRDAWNECTLVFMCAGLPETVSYFETRYRELKELADKKQGVISPRESLRIAWFMAGPCHDMGIYDWMEEEYKAIVVMESLNYLSKEVLDKMDPSDPLEYITQEHFILSLVKELYQPVKEGKFREDAVRLCQEYQVDGSISFAHWGCKQSCAIMHWLSDCIREGAKVSSMVLDGDFLDPTIASGAQMRAKLSEFFDMLLRRKKQGN